MRGNGEAAEVAIVSPRVGVFALPKGHPDGAEYRSGSADDHDDEVESAHWVPLEKATRLLSYRGERDMVAKAIERSSG